MPISIIVAHDRNRAIGRGNALPWHLPDDLKRFKALTVGKTVLMGRKTAESIGRALPGRRNLVLTRGGNAPFAAQLAVANMGAAMALCGEEELCVIGGGEIYALSLPFADRLFVTAVDTAVEDADAWFPAIDALQWGETHREHHAQDSRHAFKFDFVDLARAQ